MVGNDTHKSAGTPWHVVLPVLRKLSAEIAAGNAALARQDLKAFEKHVAAQDEICDLLQQRGVLAAPASGRDFILQLDRQKRVYEALLRRARNFAQVLLTLHQSRGGYTADGSLPLSGSTWSSEA